MIDNARLFIPFQAVQQFLQAVSPGELRECTRLDLICVQAFATLHRLTFITAANVLFNHAFSVFAPIRILAPWKLQKTVLLASFAFDIF
jgi:hypothetical protein